VRRKIVGHVSEESYQGWRVYCEQHGMTVSGFIEVLGLMFGEFATTRGDELTPVALESIQRTRDLDAARRARRPPSVTFMIAVAAVQMLALILLSSD
jgi:hypothetical protein